MPAKHAKLIIIIIIVGVVCSQKVAIFSRSFVALAKYIS